MNQIIPESSQENGFTPVAGTHFEKEDSLTTVNDKRHMDGLAAQSSLEIATQHSGKGLGAGDSFANGDSVLKEEEEEEEGTWGDKRVENDGAENTIGLEPSASENTEQRTLSKKPPLPFDSESSSRTQYGSQGGLKDSVRHIRRLSISKDGDSITEMEKTPSTPGVSDRHKSLYDAYLKSSKKGGSNTPKSTGSRRGSIESMRRGSISPSVLASGKISGRKMSKAESSPLTELEERHQLSLLLQASEVDGLTEDLDKSIGNALSKVNEYKELLTASEYAPGCKSYTLSHERIINRLKGELSQGRHLKEIEAKKKVERESENAARLSESIKATRRKYEKIRKNSVVTKAHMQQSLWSGPGNVVLCESIANSMLIVSEDGNVTLWSVRQRTEGKADESFILDDNFTIPLKEKSLSKQEDFSESHVDPESIEGNPNLPNDLQDIKRKRVNFLFQGDDITCAVIMGDKQTYGVDMKMFLGLTSGTGIIYSIKIVQDKEGLVFFKSRKEISMLKFHDCGIVHCGYNKKRKLLLTIAHDGEIKYWDENYLNVMCIETSVFASRIMGMGSEVALSDKKKKKKKTQELKKDKSQSDRSAMRLKASCAVVCFVICEEKNLIIVSTKTKELIKFTLQEDEVSHKLRYKATHLEQAFQVIRKTSTIDNPHEKYYPDDFNEDVSGLDDINNILTKSGLQVKEESKYCSINSMTLMRRGALKNIENSGNLASVSNESSNIDNLVVACEDGSIRLLSLENGACYNLILNPHDPAIPISDIKIFTFLKIDQSKLLKLLVSVTEYGGIRLHSLNPNANYQLLSAMSLEAMYPPFKICDSNGIGSASFMVIGGNEISRLSVRKMLNEIAELSFGETATMQDTPRKGSRKSSRRLSFVST
eukprot:Nk52_evm20s2039 gene=Nk52_evmTU20s2039